MLRSVLPYLLAATALELTSPVGGSFVHPWGAPIDDVWHGGRGCRVVASVGPTIPSAAALRRKRHSCLLSADSSDDGGGASTPVTIDAKLDDDKVSRLFAWVCRALAGDRRYDNLLQGVVAVFGDLPENSQQLRMLDEAMRLAPAEDEPVGEPLSLADREASSLGAMGAAQWTGRFRTRPHALLNVTKYASADEWAKSLPRGCRRTLKKAAVQNFTVVGRPILGGVAAPHSSLGHFRCVIEHEVRLMGSGSVQDFFRGLSEGIARHQWTTSQAGVIREYRNADGEIIAFSHEVTKGRTVRGQWFYASDEASKNYAWFHSVQELVRRSVEDESVDVVDLGPSGSDAFSELKERYGFLSVDDWASFADYRGPFRYNGEESSVADITQEYEKMLARSTMF